jgi:hypothetical protein
MFNKLLLPPSFEHPLEAPVKTLFCRAPLVERFAATLGITTSRSEISDRIHPENDESHSHTRSLVEELLALPRTVDTLPNRSLQDVI